MPELPEVETARRLVDTHCKGKKLVEAEFQVDEKVFCNLSSSELKAKLEGSTVTGTGRHAKYFWLTISRANTPQASTLLLHLGMTGDVIIKKPDGDLEKMEYQSNKDKDQTAWPPRFLKFELILQDETRMAFTDSRRFSRIRWIEEGDPEEQDPLNKLAPDSFTSLPSFVEWQAKIGNLGDRKKALKIKAMLLDQEEVVSGIGNWLADEILYQALVHPEQPVSTMTPSQSEAVYSKLKDVVSFSCSVDADYRQFPLTWLFHYRWTGKKASSIDGREISFLTVGSRTSAFVPSLQKITGEPRAVKAKKIKVEKTKEEEPAAAPSPAAVMSSKAGSKKRQAASLTDNVTTEEPATSKVSRRKRA